MYEYRNLIIIKKRRNRLILPGLDKKLRCKGRKSFAVRTWVQNIFIRKLK